MAGNTIANLNVKLTANISSFSSMMRSGIKSLSVFSSGVSKAASSLTSFAGIAGGALTVGALVAFTKHNMDAIDATAKLSDRLGISTEALTGLQHAADLAGVSNDELTGYLGKMLKTLGKPTPEAAAALDAMKLSSQELANSAPDEAFKKIADGLLGIQNPADRATAAVAIFGKSGQGLLPLMLSGSEGIKAAQKEAEKLGLTFSRLDAAKVEAANDAMTKLQGLLTGAGQTLAIQLAPFITAAADKLVEMGTSGEGMATKVINAFEFVLTAVAKCADWLELLRGAWYGIKTTVLMVAWGWVKQIDMMGGALVKLLNLVPGVDVKWDDTFKIMAENMWKDVSAASWEAEKSMSAFWNGTNSKAVVDTFAEIRAKADASAKAIADNAKALNGGKMTFVDPADVKRLEDIGKVITGLQTDLATFGMNDGQKKLFDLKAMGLDANSPEMQQAKKLIDQLDAKKKAKEIGDAFGQIKDDFATMGMSDTDKKLFDLKKLGMDPEQLDQARKMLEQIDAATNKPKAEKSKGPELMLAGSAEAQKLAYQASIGIKTVSNDVQQRQLKTQQDMADSLNRIEQNTREPAGLEAYA